MNRVLLILLCFLSQGIFSNLVNTHCPPGEVFNKGACALCPNNASVKNNKCVCNDPNSEISDIEVILKNGTYFQCISKNNNK